MSKPKCVFCNIISGNDKEASILYQVIFFYFEIFQSITFVEIISSIETPYCIF